MTEEAYIVLNEQLAEMGMLVTPPMKTPEQVHCRGAPN